MALKYAALPLLLSTTLAKPVQNFNRATDVTQVGNVYVVADGGSYTNAATYTFTGSSLPAGLYASGYDVDDANAPFDHGFRTSNVQVSNGYANLIVPGGQNTSPLLCAEVGTTESNILFASVRTTAIFDSSPGTVSSSFFYKSDTQETDIEWLSDASSLSNPGDGTRPLQYTNQALNGNRPADSTHSTGPLPGDATTNAHEYRIDWLPGVSKFYVDGVLQKTFETNVPSVPGSWLWNNWANGDQGWTGAPPQRDNVYRIERVEMFYNVSSSA